MLLGASGNKTSRQTYRTGMRLWRGFCRVDKLELAIDAGLINLGAGVRDKGAEEGRLGRDGGGRRRGSATTGR